jgi:hypothetical protein
MELSGSGHIVFLIAASLGWALLPVVTAVCFALWLVAGELFRKASIAT